MEKKTELYVPPRPMTLVNVLLIIVGSAMYACSYNWFLKPLNLYAGGVVGFAQLIRTLFFSNAITVDVAGIINLLLNVPLFLLAFRSMSKKMLVGTLLSVVIQTIVFTVVKIPAVPILDDKLACIVIAGLIGGIGCGIVLTNGGSAGGLDLLGVFLTQHKEKFSVGTMNLVFNGILYGFMAVRFDLATALYSVLYVAAFCLAIDRFHYQNIEVELMIFTHNREIANVIMEKYVRGVTEWGGTGAYTGRDTAVLVTIVSKSEVESVKKDVLAVDPQAFIIVHEGTHVTGGYQKRLS